MPGPNPYGKGFLELPAGIALAAGHKFAVYQDGLVRQVDAAAVGGSPAGSSGAVQYTASGSFGAMGGVVWNESRRSLAITGATVTDASLPAFSLTQTWNMGSANQVLIRAVVTDTASGSVSRFLNFETAAGGTVFSIRKDGAIITGSFQSTTPVGVAYGGTGLVGYATGDLIYASSASTLAKRAIGNTNALLTVVGGVPTWRAPTIHQRIVNANTTLDLTDWGGHVFHPASDTTPRTITIPANASVAYDIGAAITFVNDAGAGTLTIAITSDTLVLSPDGTTGSRTLAAGGIATALKVASTRWIISGPGLT